MSESANPEQHPPADSRTVALFVTCLADLMRPEAAFAAAALLEDAGYRVEVPPAQSCCGQPGYNSGDYAGAARVARRTIELLEPYPVVVLPSGSCAGMLREHYPRLLEGEWRQRATRLAARVFELTQFLADVAKYRPQRRGGQSPVAYHDACAGLRELGIREQPRQLLTDTGIRVRELSQRDVCCGFGGTFCAKMPDISAKMADDKLADAENTGAKTVVAGDLGCLLALAGRAKRRGLALQFRHVAEVLSDRPLTPPIGAPDTKR
jgi:L-lactate dehydrogenase complex protein LldE